MRAVFLASIAALFLATGTVQAADQLPEYMLGRWCINFDVSTENQNVYFRPKSGFCSDFNDGITLSQKGYTDDSPSDTANSCMFDKIEQKDEDIYLVHEECTDGHAPIDQYETFLLINGLLFKKVVLEGGGEEDLKPELEPKCDIPGCNDPILAPGQVYPAIPGIVPPLAIPGTAPGG